MADAVLPASLRLQLQSLADIVASKSRLRCQRAKFDGKTCLSILSKATKNELGNLIPNILNEIDAEDGAIVGDLETLSSLIMCKHNHQDEGRKMHEEWKKLIPSGMPQHPQEEDDIKVSVLETKLCFYFLTTYQPGHSSAVCTKPPKDVARPLSVLSDRTETTISRAANAQTNIPSSSPQPEQSPFNRTFGDDPGYQSDD